MVKLDLLLFVALLAAATATDTSTCRPLNQYWKEVEPILQAMTLDQKVGQMTQASVGLISQDHVIDPHLVSADNLGSLLIGGNFIPLGNEEYTDDTMDMSKISEATNAHWLELASQLFQPTEVDSQYEVYPLLGTDSIHGNQHVIDKVLFPHNIGLAATHDTQCFKATGYYTAKGVLASGFNFGFAPTVAVSHNPQWGRFYETMGSDPDLIYDYAAAFVEGAQSYNPDTGKYDGILASAKHFLGDGATFWGIDQGNNTVYNMRSFLEHNFQGYAGGVSQCVGNVMCSYSAVNFLPMASNSFLLNGILKEGLLDGHPFNGFVISDYDELGKMAHGKWPTTPITMDQYDAVVLMINAGVDMAMLTPYTDTLTIDYYKNALKTAVQNNDITMSRIDDAVRRILGVKMALGLIKEKSASSSSSSPFMQDFLAQKLIALEARNPTTYSSSWEAALDAAKKSLVLLKNEADYLPVQKERIKYVVLVGERTVDQTYEGQSSRIPTVYQDFNDIGSQCGGWSIRWQGIDGSDFFTGEYQEGTHASSILDAVKTRFSDRSDVEFLYTTYDSRTDMQAIKSKRAQFLSELGPKAQVMTSQNTLIIQVLAEPPYAEGSGDVNDPFCFNGKTEGCMYASHQNPYMPDQNPTTLEMKPDAFSNTVITAINAGKSEPLNVITVLFSGRPRIITDTLNSSAAFIAAWLPGTQGGEAIAQGLFGEYLFRNGSEQNKQNSLPVDWISTMKDLENFPVYKSNGDIPTLQNPLYKVGYGLATQKKN